MKPTFITFTGVDARTDMARMHELSAQYRIEWGVLFSPKRQGQENRYPDFSPADLYHIADLDLAAHICGGYSEAIMRGDDIPLDLSVFRRAQINTVSPDYDAIAEFGRKTGLAVITQARGEFDAHEHLSFLYDCSGGRGVAPTAWPRHPGFFVGYAGGINPGNVTELLDQMDTSEPFWIDMESGVRTDDWLDLDKCEAVCRAVYGDAD